MKKTLIALFAIMLFVSSLKAQWNQYLTGQTSIITEFSVVNDNVIWATDVNSTSFSISTDGGVTWQTKNFPSIITVDRSGGSNGNICAVNATTAFIIQSSGTNKGVYKTIDSGNTWTRQSTAFNSAGSFPDFVYFWNGNEGVAVGDGFEIYTTTNGGNQWNLVSSANMPAGSGWTLNLGDVFKVLGNTIYFKTNSGQILKSTDKGLNWTLVNTPLTSLNYMSFEFKDADNGLLGDYNPTTKLSTLYSTIDGGYHWYFVNSSSSNNYSQLKYLPTQNIYTNVCGAWGSSHGAGMSYSTDNGQNWIQNPSFLNKQLGQIVNTPSGKVILGGYKYIYTTTNITSSNLLVNKMHITGYNTFDITFDRNVENVTAQDTANYKAYYTMKPDTATRIYTYPVKILSSTLDNTNKSIVHIVTKTNMPIDTITAYVINVKDTYGYQIINGGLLTYFSDINSFTNGIVIPTKNNESISIIPNPVTDGFRIKGIEGKSSLQLTDLSGKVLLRKQVIGNEYVSVNGVPVGIYMIKLTNNGVSYQKKLVKK